MYDFFLIMHIFGFSLIIGWGAGMMLLPIISANTKEAPGVEFVWRMLLKGDIIYQPAALLVLISGIGLIVVGNFPFFGTPWLLAHVVGFVVIVGYGIWMSQKYSVPLWRMAERDMEAGQISEEALALLRQKNIAFLIWFAIILAQLSLPFLGR